MNLSIAPKMSNWEALQYTNKSFLINQSIPELKMFMRNHCFYSWQLCALLFKQWIHKENQLNHKQNRQKNILLLFSKLKKLELPWIFKTDLEFVKNIWNALFITKQCCQKSALSNEKENDKLLTVQCYIQSKHRTLMATLGLSIPMCTVHWRKFKFVASDWF
jgi:hypothetical protein